MLIIRLLRYIQGYCRVEASGGFPERFVNLCTKNRIPVWDIRRVGEVLVFYCSSAYIDMLEIAAEKAGMNLISVDETGLRLFLKKHKKRKGLLAAAAVCLILTVFLSQFVWSVSVEGNSFYTDEQILEAFEVHGVKIGSLKSRIDTRSVSESVVTDLERISWTKVNIRGCFAVIEVRETVPKPEIFDRGKPINIVASDDGLILRNEVEVGSPAVKSGIAVTKGDLLVSAVLVKPDGSEELVHSKAFVTAEVRKQIILDINTAVNSLSLEKQKSELFFFGLEIPKFKNKQDYFEQKIYVENEGRLLPFGVFGYRKILYESPCEIDTQSASLLSLHRFGENAIEYLTDTEKLIDYSVNVSGNSVTGEFTVEKNIGVEQEVFTE